MLLLYIVIGIALLIIALIVIGMYNNLIGRRNRVQDALAQIDVQLKRRYDLIPNLVETVKGYMTYEKNVLTKITSMRSSIVSGSLDSKAQANNQISQALKTIFAVAENYPQLKASENFQSLQNELEDTENKISYVRTSYNDYVLDYNNAIQTWPGSAFANWFHFQKADFFTAPEEAKEPVKVSFADTNAQNDDMQQAQPKPRRQQASKQQPTSSAAQAPSQQTASGPAPKQSKKKPKAQPKKQG